jgi:hypothetical protein
MMFVDEGRAAEPHFLRAPTPYLRGVIAHATEVGSQLELAGRHTEAFEVFRRAYEALLAAQTGDWRYHKGEPLASMGWVKHRSGRLAEGAQWTALAFIEDSLSRAEELPGVLDELSRPAAQNLRMIGAPDRELYDAALAIRSIVALGQLVADPFVTFFGLGLDQRIGQWLSSLNRSDRSRQDSIRVFISSPGDLIAERRVLAEICRELTLTMPAHVEALLWEGGGPRNPEVQPFPPEITGAGAQAVIDHHIWSRLGGYHVYVGMIWRRMGTPTGHWRSGTEAEFHFAYDRSQIGQGPTKMLFYEKAARPMRLRDPQAANFLHDVQMLGPVTRFDTAEDLRRAAFTHLAGVVRELTSRP